MQKASHVHVQRGRPVGTKTYEPDAARAFGMAVRARRFDKGVAQEALAQLAGIERSHMGKIERGEHLPTLALILRIAEALGCTATALVADTEAKLGEIRRTPEEESAG